MRQIWQCPSPTECAYTGVASTRFGSFDAAAVLIMATLILVRWCCGTGKELFAAACGKLPDFYGFNDAQS